MDFKPITAVWEITMGCNMRCKHCGSACTTPLAGELTTEEAFSLCDEIGEMEFKWITLSGGEPTIRRDWDQIALRLYNNGVIPNMISNGWLVNDDIVKRAEAAHVNTIAISIDGLRETHDTIRKQGSYDRIMTAYDVLKASSVHGSAITTINRKNIHQLPELLKILEARGVVSWQLQLGLPMGTMAHNTELIADPSCIDEVINFSHTYYKQTNVDIQFADCIGYFNAKEIEVRQKGNPENGYEWQGCGAGKTSMGILHNGEILGCTSIRERDFIEGSIKERSLKEIWESPSTFLWNRDITKSKLSGFCLRCKYGSLCLGGCSNTRLTMSGSIYGENKYCSYSYIFSIADRQLEQIQDISTVAARARMFIEKENIQLAEILLRKALIIQPDNIELLGLYGYVSFMLENYREAEIANSKALQINPRDSYANKGMGLTLCRLGNLDEGISYLHKAIDLADASFTDPYHDLTMVLVENNRIDEARSVITEGKNKYSDFYEKNRDLYEKILHSDHALDFQEK